MPAFCIRKITVTKMKAAQPFMLMVVQIGSTKRATGERTPTLFSEQAIVTGSVPAEDFEKNATASAGAMPLATRIGLRPRSRSRAGSTRSICTKFAVMTVAK